MRNPVSFDFSLHVVYVTIIALFNTRDVSARTHSIETAFQPTPPNRHDGVCAPNTCLYCDTANIGMLTAVAATAAARWQQPPAVGDLSRWNIILSSHSKCMCVSFAHPLRRCCCCRCCGCQSCATLVRRRVLATRRRYDEHVSADSATGATMPPLTLTLQHTSAHRFRGVGSIASDVDYTREQTRIYNILSRTHSLARNVRALPVQSRAESSARFR